MMKYLALFALVMVAVGIVGCSSKAPDAAAPTGTEGTNPPAPADTADVDAAVDATVPTQSDDVQIGEIV